MELKFRCGKCNRKLEAAATMAGSVVSCPNCGSDVVIPEARLAPGVTLAGFRIEKEIGRGAMGQVFLATQLTMDRRVALKVLPSPRVADSEFVERFFKEVRLAARLEHSHIVTAFDAGEDHGYYYFAMEFVDGESLDVRLKRDGAMPEKEAVALVLSVAEALSYAWDQSRILHRDVKPANIMVDTDGHAMIMDMGIATNAGDQSHLTATGVAVGTPHYMSPEQARGSHDLDFRADQYSLGATLFHLVSGRVPFTGTSAVEVITKHLHEPVPLVRSVNPAVSQDCEAVILRMMAKDRTHRYASWEACIRDMHAVLKGKPPETSKAKLARQASELLVQQRSFAALRPSADSPRRKVFVLIVLAVLGLAAVGAAVAVTVARQKARVSESRAITPDRPQGSAAAGTVPAETAAGVAKADGGESGSGKAGTSAAGTPTVVGRPATAAGRPPASSPQTPPGGTPAVPVARSDSSQPQPTAKAGSAVAAATEPPPSVALPVPAAEPLAPVPADPFTLALEQVAGELISNRPVAAAALWDQARPLLEPTQPTQQLDEIAASLAHVANTERRIMESYRKNMGTPITIRLKDRQCRVLIKAVTPPTAKTLELLDNGSIGGSFSLADLDISEKLGRLAAPDAADAALARGLVAIWDGRFDLAVPELRVFDTPLARALLSVLEAKASEEREQAAERAYVEVFRQVQRNAPPKEPEKVIEALRERLDTDRRRERFLERVTAYEAAYNGTKTGAQRLALLKEALNYPFTGSPWTVPGIGMEFAWVEALAGWVGVYEVTNAQYRQFDPDHNSAAVDDVPLNADDQPAVWISFDDAEGFAAFLTKRERDAGRLPPAWSYRLPRQSEWTTLASCGDSRTFPWGETWPPPPELNYNGSEWPGPEGARIVEHKDAFPGTCPVAASAPNSWGLRGVGGNAFEWTSGENGMSPELRGNAWCGSGASHSSQSGYTVKSSWPRPNPGFRSPATGFRLLLAQDAQSKPVAPITPPAR